MRRVISVFSLPWIRHLVGHSPKERDLLFQLFGNSPRQRHWRKILIHPLATVFKRNSPRSRGRYCLAYSRKMPRGRAYGRRNRRRSKGDSHQCPQGEKSTNTPFAFVSPESPCSICYGRDTGDCPPLNSFQALFSDLLKQEEEKVLSSERAAGSEGKKNSRRRFKRP